MSGYVKTCPLCGLDPALCIHESPVVPVGAETRELERAHEYIAALAERLEGTLQGLQSVMLHYNEPDVVMHRCEELSAAIRSTFAALPAAASASEWKPGGPYVFHGSAPSLPALPTPEAREQLLDAKTLAAFLRQEPDLRCEVDAEVIAENLLTHLVDAGIFLALAPADPPETP